ncbi:MAG: type I restriction enzyme HsdR N-terminal domain-containing protein [Candidatus Ornithobacterium hominis]|nr:type I restriction enzyme HsdR N-terminal domain-containing protein [Candidatus Ornithobacterium hominis]MCT7903936.1 type I restriction enzyme HsdR N-terminal domain-containing protein [Candidatus Ornithobacterium hominis]
MTLPKFYSMEDDAKNFLSLEKKGNKIYCAARKIWLVRTPEEEVRQHFILWLSQELGYPISLMQAEKKVNQRVAHRFDLFIQAKQKIILCEFKAPKIIIDQSVLNQIIRYQPQVNADYFLLSNGVETLIFFVDKKLRKIKALENLPNYHQL